MAKMFLKESSPRDLTIPKEEYDAKYEATFGGPRKKVVCNVCGEVKGKYRNGVCGDCERVQKQFKPLSFEDKKI